MSDVEVEEYERGVEGEDPLTCHRAGTFVDLGFEVSDAFVLAKSRGLNGFHLYWGDVKKMLEGGASHQQVVAIFA